MPHQLRHSKLMESLEKTVHSILKQHPEYNQHKLPEHQLVERTAHVLVTSSVTIEKILQNIGKHK